jgi:hypothetical protein
MVEPAPVSVPVAGVALQARVAEARIRRGRILFMQYSFVFWCFDGF